MRKSLRISVLIFTLSILWYYSWGYLFFFDFIKSLDIFWTILGFVSGIGTVYFFSKLDKSKETP